MKETSSEQETYGMVEFRPAKYLSGALTWIVCAVLIFLCYLETKILPMLLLVPFLIIMAMGFYREYRLSYVKLENGEMVVKDFSAFSRANHNIKIDAIDSLVLDSTKDHKSEIIHSIMVCTDKERFQLPDIEHKEILLEKLKTMNPAIKIKTL